MRTKPEPKNKHVVNWVGVVRSLANYQYRRCLLVEWMEFETILSGSCAPNPQLVKLPVLTEPYAKIGQRNKKHAESFSHFDW